jgi:hypothetical protein
MFRSPWELDAHIRDRQAELASESQRCARIREAGSGSRGRLTQLRQRIGISLIQAGATIAGFDALATPRAWPNLANR